MVVVVRCVGSDPLMPTGEGFHSAGRVAGFVVDAVGGDHPVDFLGAVSGEEHLGSVEESDFGLGRIVSQLICLITLQLQDTRAH